jgi:hypothetical protein
MNVEVCDARLTGRAGNKKLNSTTIVGYTIINFIKELNHEKTCST